MDNKRTTILAFVAIAMMIAVAFIGSVAIADVGSDATDEETNIVSVTIGGTETKYTDLSKAVEAVNSATTGDVEFKLLDSISITEAGTAKQAAIWFTYTGGTITVDGDKKTITYNAAYGSGQNVMGFASGVTAIVKDLTIDGNNVNNSTNYAYHGINIYGAKSVNLEKVTVKNVKAAGIIANSENVVMNGCDVSENCGWGGVNVDIGSRTGGKSNLTIQGTFAGKIWTESLGVSTVTYDGAKITMTMTTQDGNSNWKFWYSSEDLDAVVKEAVANADDEDKAAKDFVITLMDDVTLNAEKAVSDGAINVTKDMTIDLGGKKLTVNSESGKAYYHCAINVNTAILTLRNGTVEVPFVKAAQDSVIKVYGQSAEKKGQLTTEDVTIISGGQNSAYSGYGIFAAAYSNVVVDGGTTITADYAAISGNGSASGATKGTGASITINDGTFESRKATCVYFPNVDSLTVKGGTFTGASGFEIRAGTVTISGATINVVSGGTLSVADSGKSPLGVAYAIMCTNVYASDFEMSVTIGKNTLNLAEDCYAFYLGAPLNSVKYITADDITSAAAIGKSSMTVTYNDMTLSASGSTSQLASMLIDGNGDIIKVGGEIKGVQGTLSFNTEADVTISDIVDDIVIKGVAGDLTITGNEFIDVDLQLTSVNDLKVSDVVDLVMPGALTCVGDIEISNVDNISISGKLIIKSGSTLSIDGVSIIAKATDFTAGQISITTNTDGGFDVSLDKAVVSIAAFSVWEKDKLTVGEGSTLTLAGALIDNGTVIVNGKLIASETNYVQIYSGRTLVLNEGAVITGKIIGNGDNSVVVNGLKAGSDGITFTSGSLKINGKIVSESTAGVTVKIVSGTEVIISGQLDAGATMEIDEGTTVTIESGKTFSSGGTITNNGAIINNGTVSNSGSIVNNGAVTNAGTLKVTDEATVTGSNIVNSGIVADERSSGTAVPIDTSKSTGAVVTESNAKAYDGTGVKVIVEDPETSGTTEGTVTSDSSSYAFIDTITTTGKLNVIMNDGYKQYTITIPKGTTIAATTIISVEYLDFTSDTTKYEITTPGIDNFSVKVPVQTGFKSAKVYCDGSTAGVSNVKYSANSGYVTFDAGHNSTFTIVLSNATPSSGTSDAIDEDTVFVASIVVLVVAILALAVVIKRK